LYILFALYFVFSNSFRTWYMYELKSAQLNAHKQLNTFFLVKPTHTIIFSAQVSFSDRPLYIRLLDFSDRPLYVRLCELFWSPIVRPSVWAFLIAHCTSVC
jgi:hypothetical protein